MAHLQAEKPVRKQRSDGARSRNAILREAAQLATVEGIEGLSISRLADAVGMSKSGLFAHFGSKQELQLATVDTAADLFDELVIHPAASAPNGLERLQQYGERYLDHVEEKVYPGGCFFASVASELDTQSGPVRDRALECVEGWLGQLEVAIVEAQSDGAIDASIDPPQLTFELDSYLFFANLRFVSTDDPEQIKRGRMAFRARLAAAGA